MRPAESRVPDLVSIEELDQNILDLAARINIATCELIVLIREFDERVERERHRFNELLESLKEDPDAFAPMLQELWKTMNEKNESSIPEYMSTHPSGETRIEELIGHYPTALVYYNQAKDAGKTPNCQR